MPRFLLATLFLLPLVACGGGSDAPGDGPAAGVAPLLAAGSTKLEPTTRGDAGEGIDLGRIDVDSITTLYDLTTPVDEPLAIDVLYRCEGNAGPVRVSVAHLGDGEATPAGGPETLAAAGLVASGPGRASRGPWIDATGDGFSRITLRGAITQDQILAVQAADGDDRGTALVRIRIGPPSVINAASDPGDEYPGIVDETTLYSSNSWCFGLPTIAVSGDRTSIVCYEGDRGSPDARGRYEMRLQHDGATGVVTGGGSEETSPDSGNWRDHEIAALYNVLALVHGTGDAITLKLSFDRGATFAQEERFLQGGSAWRPRLVQVAMALDYSLAVLFWRSNHDGSTDLALVEGRPSAYDGTGSPTAFAFDPLEVIYHDAFDATPMLMSAVWSDGGDLVIGYAFTRFRTLPDTSWESLTQNRCAVRPWGGTFADVLVEEDRIVGKDPSVAVTGQGDTLRIFYAYERADGVGLRVSEDGGHTFSAPIRGGASGAHMPTVFAREGDTGTTVDLLYLGYGARWAMELHLLHWPVFSLEVPGEVYRLTQAVVEDGGELPPDRPVPGAEEGALPPGYGPRVTQVAWFGYDAVLDGDEIVVVYDEETYDAVTYLDGPVRGLSGDAPASGYDEGFVPVDPPPLAPGMTEPVPDPDPDEMHQLKLLRLR